jgi:hypothetical protein
MYANDMDTMRQQAHERQRALLREAHVDHLLRMHKRCRSSWLLRLRTFLGRRLVAWGTRLQQQSGSTITQKSYSA